MAEKDPKVPQDSIPASKVERASKFVKTGVKVGGNYLKHYAKKIVDPSLSTEDLHRDNAKDIYESLSELKGSALKIAQMMSMDKNIMPQAYTEQFQMAQYSAPPLSYPLVVRTFQKHLGKTPTEMFDTFTQEAVNAASIGQVHQATKNGQKLAVKVQYPGVAESIGSDLRIVKPFATSILGVSEKDVDYYMEEVERMMLAETDYELELKRSQMMSEACAFLDGARFPKYFPEYSSSRILTMEWLPGMHLDAFLQTNPSQEVRDKIGQLLWDFYDFQMHNLRAVHADPHPGNFLMGEDGTLGIIDFGCVKEIPDDFYQLYFDLLSREVIEDPVRLEKAFYDMSFIYPDDTQEDLAVLKPLFKQILVLLERPFHEGQFDFGNDAYFQELFDFGKQSSKIPQLRHSKRPRGSKHGLYINRTYFGLYNILNSLRARVQTGIRRFAAV